MEDKWCQPIYGEFWYSQCKGCIYNFKYIYCEHYQKNTSDDLLSNAKKCPYRESENAK